MKTLLLLLSLAVLGGALPHQDGRDPQPHQLNTVTDTVYVTIDEKTVVDSKIRYNHGFEENYPEESVVVDEQFADTKAMMESKYPEFKTSYLFQDRRTILGFDAPTLSSISRLTLRIRFKMYGKIDIFNLSPKVKEENFIIKASNRYQPYNYYYFHDSVSGAETKEDYINNFTIPYIGRPSDIVALENKLAASQDLTGSIWGAKNAERDFSSVIDNPAWGDNYYSISRDPLKNKGYYVVMPCFFDITQAWISVAGVDTNGNPVLDGLDTTGLPYIDELTQLKYVDIGYGTTRAIYFTEHAIIKEVNVISGHVVDTASVAFGDYDFAENEWKTQLATYGFNPMQLEYEGLSLSVPIGNFAVFTPDSGDAVLRVFYQSLGAAVYVNILGSDGVEIPVTETGPTTTAYDESTIPDTFWSTLSLLLAAVGILVGGSIIAWHISKRRK